MNRIQRNPVQWPSQEDVASQRRFGVAMMILLTAAIAMGAAIILGVLAMSVDAWVIATVDHLRAALVAADQIPGGESKARNYVDVQPGGHPPASMGEFYVAVDEAGVTNKLIEGALYEVYSLAVHITKRTGQFARDRYGDMYRDNARSLRRLERAVIVAIHNNHLLRIAVNTELGVPDADVGDACTHPLWYTGRVPTRPELGDWAGAQPDAASFLVRVLNFRGGNRPQKMDVAG